MLKTMWLIAVGVFIFVNANAQKTFNITVQIPAWADAQKLSLSYNNGKDEFAINNAAFIRGSINFSGTFYSKYAAVLFHYPKANTQVSDFYNCFFINDAPAKIILSGTDSTQSPFEHYELTNAFDFRTEKDSMAAFVYKENKEFTSFEIANEIAIKEGKDSTVLKEFTNRLLNKKIKELVFVRSHSKSYYSFWYFKNYLMSPSFKSNDSLLQIFNATFSDSLRKSEEGYAVISTLKGRMFVHKNYAAPDFVSKDKDGKRVALKDYKNKKDVLLVFWATWCGPCVEEIPLIKAIHDNYSPEKLEVISIAYPSDMASYRKAIKDHNMDWTQIYNDGKLIVSYGGYKGIPRILLIDKAGQIVYENTKYDRADEELIMLHELLKDE